MITQSQLQPEPYTSDDLYCPIDEGRSLHDDVSYFYRTIMKLDTPVTKSPIVTEVIKAIESYEVTPNDDRLNSTLLNVRNTRILDLWPFHNGRPPPNAIGVFCVACHRTDSFSTDNSLVDLSDSVDLSHETSTIPNASISPSNISTMVQMPTYATQETNKLSLKYFLDPCNKILIDEKLFFKFIQDSGFSTQNLKTKKRGSYYDDKTKYGYTNIYNLSSKLYFIMEQHKEFFNKLAKNKFNIQCRISK